MLMPSRWAPACRLHTNFYKFGENVSSHIFHKKNCCDLNLGESLCISTFFPLPDSGLNLLNGFEFYSDLFWMVWHWKTAIDSILSPQCLALSRIKFKACSSCFLCQSHSRTLRMLANHALATPRKSLKSTLKVPLFIQVYKWVPTNLLPLGVTPRWTSIPNNP